LRAERIRISMSVVIRTEESFDVDAIAAVHRACFPTDGEARLVDALRAAGRLTISLVAVVDAAVVGHVAFSPVMTADGETGLGLGPIGVLESHRRQGIADGLVRTGLLACKTAGYAWVVVLGDPAYYGRFGFGPASTFGLSDEYGGCEHFQAIELLPGELPTGAGLVRYAPEFSAVA
jgi:putative acetyltransferase